MLVGKGKQIKMGKKLLGYLGSDRIFRIPKKEKHKFRIYNGWSINRELMKELIDIQAQFVEIMTEKRILKIQISKIIEHGIPYQNPKGEKDYQLVVPEKFFEIREI